MGKSGRCIGLTTLPPSCTDCLEIWEPQPPGTLRACPGLYWDCFTFTFTFTFVHQGTAVGVKYVEFFVRRYIYCLCWSDFFLYDDGSRSMLTKLDDTRRGSALWVIRVDMARDGSVSTCTVPLIDPPANKVFLLAV